MARLFFCIECACPQTTEVYSGHSLNKTEGGSNSMKGHTEGTENP